MFPVRWLKETVKRTRRRSSCLRTLVEGLKRYKLFRRNAKDEHTSNANRGEATLNALEGRRFCASWRSSRLSFRGRMLVYSGGALVVKHFSNGRSINARYIARCPSDRAKHVQRLTMHRARLRRNRARREKSHFHKFLPIVLGHVAR